MNSHRQYFLRICSKKSACLLGSFLLALFCLYNLPSTADDTGPRQGRQITLKQQLTAGLKAFTPGDKAFIDMVVIKVQQGVLPRSLVDSTFLWAREKAEARSPSRALRPMVYFKPALVARAKRLDIKL